MAALGSIDDSSGEIGDTFGNMTVTHKYGEGKFRFASLPLTAAYNRTGTLNAVNFGIKADGSDNTTKFQSWIDELAADNRTFVDDEATGLTVGDAGFRRGLIPAGNTYIVNGTVTIPDMPVGVAGSLHIDAHGSLIRKAEGTGAIFKTRDFTSHSDAANTTSNRDYLKWSGGALWCLSSLEDTYGMHLQSTSFCHIDGVQFNGFSTGLRADFALHGLFTRLKSSACSDYDFNIRHGSWTGATGANSASNMAHLVQCRATSGCDSQFYIEESAGVVLDSCTSEGSDPTNAIYYRSANTSATNFIVRNHWVENEPTTAVKLDAIHGVELDFGFIKASDVIFVDADGATNKPQSIRINNMPVLDTAWSSPRFKGSGAAGQQWHFGRITNSGKFDPFDEDIWVDDVIGYSTYFGKPLTGNTGTGFAVVNSKVPVALTGSRADTEEALANLITRLEGLRIIDDQTTAT